ncbi:MAG: recombinase family protein [Pseudomonadota bacterium]
MARVGYARVSTRDQNLALQLEALRADGCDPIFEDDGVSACARVRPAFQEAMDTLSRGDVLVVWKMDRAFRSLKDALDHLETFNAQGIGFQSITEPLETVSAMGLCMYQVRHVFAELERNLIRERTIAGMEAARARGVRVGRPPKMTDDQVRQATKILRNRPEVTRVELAARFQVSQRTISRLEKRLAAEGVSP